MNELEAELEHLTQQARDVTRDYKRRMAFISKRRRAVEKALNKNGQQLELPLSDISDGV